MVADPRNEGGLPEADLVVAFDVPEVGAGWEESLVARARASRKILLVVARNPEHLGGLQGSPVPDTIGLARVLWRVGRVREHAYLGAPRWVQALERVRGRRFSEDAIQAPASMSVRLSAPLHAFVVDTAPRTPQARRRLGLAVG
jgi:hypothetical protein